MAEGGASVGRVGGLPSSPRHQFQVHGPVQVSVLLPAAAGSTLWHVTAARVQPGRRFLSFGTRGRWANRVAPWRRIQCTLAVPFGAPRDVLSHVLDLAVVGHTHPRPNRVRDLRRDPP